MTKKFKVSTYNNFHGVPNVLGIRFDDDGDVIERHVEMPVEISVDGVALCLEKLANAIRKEVKLK